MESDALMDSIKVVRAWKAVILAIPLGIDNRAVRSALIPSPESTANVRVNRNFMEYGFADWEVVRAGVVRSL